MRSSAPRLRVPIVLPILIAALLGAPAAAHASQQSAQSARSDFPTLSTSAERAREAGRLGEAVALYRQALTRRPSWKEGWWGLGTILYDQDASSEAARAFRRLTALDPKNGTAYLMLALCEYQLGAYERAMTHIQAARKLGVQADGDLPNVLVFHEGMLLLHAGRYERALETLRSLAAARVDDEDLDLALGMGVLLMRPKDLPAEGTPPHMIVLRAGRAERHHLVRDFDAARRGYAALVQEAPTFPNVHYAYGRFLLETDGIESGVAQFLAEIEQQPSHVRARVQIAAARYRVDSPAALPFAREVVRLAPRYPFGHYILGLLLLDTGDVTSAIPLLETAARMRPDEPQFQFALGNAYAGAGRTADAARARSAFTRLSRTPSNAPEANDLLRGLDLDEPPVRRPPDKSGGSTRRP